MGSKFNDEYGSGVYRVIADNDKEHTCAYVTFLDAVEGKFKVEDYVVPEGTETSFKIVAIDNRAFEKCQDLTEVVIGKYVESIGDYAFHDCYKLKKVTIPSKVKKIGKAAFRSCKALKNIYVKTKKLTSASVGSKAFYKTYDKPKVYVPNSKLSAYKSLFTARKMSKNAKFYGKYK